ncbi:MAG TPA: hypothetical protein VHG91_15225 [Longimicrobium sp.]|nr:hypothetical protein [Longimicrobium sp.]
MSKLTLRSALFAAAAGILITIGGCAESPALAARDTAEYRIVPAAPSAARAGDAASATIGAEGGALQAGGHKLVFPAGALSQPTRITLQAAGTGVVVQPHGLVFAAGREPVLTLDNTGVAVQGFRTLAIGYINEAGAIAEVLPTEVLGGGSKLRARLQHFSIYTAVGG